MAETEGEGTCLTLLFDGWILNSRLKYACGLFFTFLWGLTSEYLVSVRRTQFGGDASGGRAEGAASTTRDLLDTMLYRLQMSVGYCLMLVAMTYHLPFLAAIAVGVAVGHRFFNWKCGRFASPAVAPSPSRPRPRAKNTNQRNDCGLRDRLQSFWRSGPGRPVLRGRRAAGSRKGTRHLGRLEGCQRLRCGEVIGSSGGGGGGSAAHGHPSVCHWWDDVRGGRAATP